MENSEFKPVLFPLKTDLVSYPTCGGGGWVNIYTIGTQWEHNFSVNLIILYYTVLNIKLY